MYFFQKTDRIVNIKKNQFSFLAQIKCVGVIAMTSFIALGTTGCQRQVEPQPIKNIQQTPHTSHAPQKKRTAPPVPVLWTEPEVFKPEQPKMTMKNKMALWPEDYKQFYQREHLDDKDSYSNFLMSSRDELPALPQLMRSAKNYSACNAERYMIPDNKLWPNILPTVDVVKNLERLDILTDYSITSVYRDSTLNKCVGGADNSKHMLNAAVDITLQGEQATVRGRQEVISELCRFWAINGKALQLGLGTYASGAIHLDTLGYRTWGSSKHSDSAICAS